MPENGAMRGQATIMHLDLDAFFASVEQRDKPSLRGKPVIVGGLGPRGVVSTASYEARVFGVRSAMRMVEARSRCPHAAFLAGRFAAYRATSSAVMARLRQLSPLVESLSLDEAFVDLAAEPADDSLDVREMRQIGERVRADVASITGGLTASVGLASSKLLAKIASEINKPDGLYLVEPGSEQDLLAPMPVSVIPGIGPATSERLRRVGVLSVAELRRVSLEELQRLVGAAHGQSLYDLARAVDPRPVVAEREAKSVSVEDTFEADITDRAHLSAVVNQLSRLVAARLRKSGMSGRTVTLKVRHHDFATNTRSATFAGPTDDPQVLSRMASTLLSEIDASDGLRLVGVGVSGLADWVQQDLFTEPTPLAETVAAPEPATTTVRTWAPGMDVTHDDLGPGWVWGSGRGLVTVRFETRYSSPGPVHTLDASDPALRPGTVEP